MTKYAALKDSKNDWVSLSIDEMTAALNILDYAHHEIHEGSHFKVGHQDTTMSTDDEISMLFITPDTSKHAHFTLTAQSTGSCTVSMYEGPNVTSNGTGLTPKNRNRNSSKVSVLSVYHTPTISTAGAGNGTKWAEKWIGGSGFKESIGGEHRGDSEIILKQNTTYLVICTANADTIKCAIGGDWYEHTTPS